MKRLLVSVLVGALVGVFPAHATTYVCEAPRCEDIQVPAPGLIVPDDHVRVLLPADYGSTTKRYPVLYLLHGAGDTYKTWSENTDVDSLTANDGLIVVMPDAGKSPESGWYTDWVDHSRQWESFHIGAMIPYIDATFRTLADKQHRAVAGLSMGGYGAMYYAAKYPQLFGLAASFSGAVDITYGTPASGVAFSALHQMYGTPNDNVWGNQVTDRANWQAHNPADLAADLAGVKVLLATGDGLPGGTHEDPSNLGGYGLEQGIFQMNLSFVRALTLAGVAHTDRFYGSGQHSWPYWQDDLHWAMPDILTTIG
ncbi:MAG: alpha/beta hydrolase [Actinomycetota bacterium]